ncbi:FadR/GntR family transcriptional regulator [Oleiagrimonas sp. C23AA]|uniref:FadR/GntR family transcriptional regulator n=1 Tax=Oleiagrimonas sp. C23AA TaxID=2719047 RepID=UPI001424380C|nr:FadR/GntR family transcriptional regulator [Oleiagrimonas sp. C23AA]NII12198.1 FadR family transcriptional regulator [Oleiagrimonas sp. C23AA]
MSRILARNLHGHVVRVIGQQIVNGELTPGTVLPREDLLAEQMGVSRTALREGLRVLAAKGLVEARPKVGTRIREEVCWQQLDADVLAWRCAHMPEADFVGKLVELREIIEPAAAATAARRCDGPHFERLEQAFHAMEAAADMDAWASADLAFHKAVLDATQNDLMSSLFAVVDTALGMYFEMSARSAKQFNYSLPHHRKVFEAIRKRQPEAARRAMQRMIVDSRENMETGKRPS